jgi:malic enzyme
MSDEPTPIGPIPMPLRGRALLSSPMFNKSTAFTPAERSAFGLQGLLPPQVIPMAGQVRRAYETIRRKPEPIEKYIGLVALQDRNEHLFYRLLLDHLEELMPIVYTPTVGQACQEYSHIYRQARGLWITPDDRGHIERVLTNAPYSDVRLIVVTDNERILGLGDLGAGGIGISIGKLTLYTVGAGIHPAQGLPISLDVGTDNEELRKDPLYLGWPHPRLRGEPYDEFIEEFIEAVIRVFPDALLQWEDFKKQNAFHLLDRYRDRLPSFNDDIQGTAAIGVAAVIAAGRMTKMRLVDQRILMIGSGAAGVGIGRQVRSFLESAGLSGSELVERLLLMDSTGLLHDGRNLTEQTKRDFAWPVEMAKAHDLPLDDPDNLVKVIHAYKPTVLIGTSGQPGLFSEEAVRAMAEYVERPVILPFSNPNSKCEGVPADIIGWTEGRAIIATGSPYDPVEYNGRTFKISQGNNAYVFPGVGLGALVCKARRVSDAMFTAAARALADQVSEEDIRSGALFPPISELRRVSKNVARAVVEQAQADGMARKETADPAAAVTQAMWYPAYPVYTPA